MKVALAQIKSIRGDIQANIKKHVAAITIAARKKANLIVFPELSLMSYEPELAKELAMHLKDSRLDIFQSLSDQFNITICLGAPLKNENTVQISMFVFQAKVERISYSKQLLHKDELTYFSVGNNDLIININDALKLAPAICYESLQPVHVKKVTKLGATIYMTSLAKDSRGMTKAHQYYSDIAIKYKIGVVATNAIGQCEGFLASGESAIWNEEGKLIAHLNSELEGIIVLDTSFWNTEEITL